MGPASQGEDCLCKAPGWTAQRHFSNYIRGAAIQVKTSHLSSPPAMGLGPVDKTLGCARVGTAGGGGHLRQDLARRPWPLAPFRGVSVGQALGAPGQSLLVGERGPAALVLQGRWIPGRGPESFLWTSLGSEV